MEEVAVSLSDITIFLYDVLNPEHIRPTKLILDFLRTKYKCWPHLNLSAKEPYSLFCFVFLNKNISGS